MNPLIAAVDLELSLMGDFADIQVPGKFQGITIRNTLEQVKTWMTPMGIRDALRLIEELWLALNFNGYGVHAYGHNKHSEHFETVIRLIELKWRIQKEFKYL